MNVPWQIGVADLTASQTPTVADTLWIGHGPGLGSSFDGQIGEIIIYSRVLTTLEQEQVNCYLEFKWVL